MSLLLWSLLLLLFCVIVVVAVVAVVVVLVVVVLVVVVAVAVCFNVVLLDGLIRSIITNTEGAASAIGTPLHILGELSRLFGSNVAIHLLEVA